ncbi:MAG: F-box protein [Chlamydiae bacterium]|nr:F-box protein [Chlamydiota bacterium]
MTSNNISDIGSFSAFYNPLFEEPELFEKIFSYLSKKELLKLGSTCTYFKWKIENLSKSFLKEGIPQIIFDQIDKMESISNEEKQSILTRVYFHPPLENSCEKTTFELKQFVSKTFNLKEYPIIYSDTIQYIQKKDGKTFHNIEKFSDRVESRQIEVPSTKEDVRSWVFADRWFTLEPDGYEKNALLRFKLDKENGQTVGILEVSATIKGFVEKVAVLDEDNLCFLTRHIDGMGGHKIIWLDVSENKLIERQLIKEGPTSYYLAKNFTNFEFLYPIKTDLGWQVTLELNMVGNHDLDKSSFIITLNKENYEIIIDFNYYIKISEELQFKEENFKKTIKIQKRNEKSFLLSVLPTKYFTNYVQLFKNHLILVTPHELHIYNFEGKCIYQITMGDGNLVKRLTVDGYKIFIHIAKAGIGLDDIHYQIISLIFLPTEGIEISKRNYSYGKDIFSFFFYGDYLHKAMGVMVLCVGLLSASIFYLLIKRLLTDLVSVDFSVLSSRFSIHILVGNIDKSI